MPIIRRLLLLTPCLVAAISGGVGCDAPRVAQGRVVDVSGDRHSVVIRDDRKPHALMTFSVRGAEMGAALERGDRVRVAYREVSGGLVAHRVMNITRQAKLLGGGGH